MCSCVKIISTGCRTTLDNMTLKKLAPASASPLRRVRNCRSLTPNQSGAPKLEPSSTVNTFVMTWKLENVVCNYSSLLNRNVVEPNYKVS